MNSTDVFAEVSPDGASNDGAGIGTMVAAGSVAAALGYVAWEQLKFCMYRAGKNHLLPAELVARPEPPLEPSPRGQDHAVPFVTGQRARR
eukprot:gene16402-22609_t